MRTLLLVMLAACSHDIVEPPPQDGDRYWPGAEWRRTAPEGVGLDKDKLQSLVSDLKNNRIPGIHSLLIVRQGYLAVEEYFNGSSAESVHTLQSDTKSVTSLLLGIALGQGKVSGVDRPVVSFFPEYPDLQNNDSRKQAVTLEHILTMRTGLDWSENNYAASPLAQLNGMSTGWLRLVLDWPMRELPGTRFEYNSGGVIVLGGVIYNTTGMTADAFARQYLFDPIGVGPADWFIGGPNGLPHMGGGLSLRAKDMARIGYLVLRNGVWGNRQVVPASWLEASLRASVTDPRTFAGHPVDYGYLWWILHLPTGDPVYTASGAQGQWIFIIPKYDVVVVSTANTSRFDTAVEFLYQRILPAVR